MAISRIGSRRLVLAWILASTCLLGAQTSLAQVGAGLHKDEAAPDTTVAVSEGESGLENRFTIEFGDEKDWVRLASGEWLRGNVERMRDGSLEFNSDEIKLITYDWKKVLELHSPRAKLLVDGSPHGPERQCRQHRESDLQCVLATHARGFDDPRRDHL